jgi:hypothetical protein
VDKGGWKMEAFTEVNKGIMEYVTKNMMNYQETMPAILALPVRFSLL